MPESVDIPAPVSTATRRSCQQGDEFRGFHAYEGKRGIRPAGVSAGGHNLGIGFGGLDLDMLFRGMGSRNRNRDGEDALAVADG